MAHKKRQDLSVTGSEIPFVDTLVSWIHKKKLATPATFFLEMHRPLMPLAHPAALLCGPFVAPFFGPDYYEKVEALRDPAVLERILNRLADKPEAAPPGTPHKGTRL